MNLSTSRASAVRQTPPVEQAGDSKNKHAIKLLLALLDGIIPSKTKLKAQSIGLMPRLSLRPLSHEEFCTFGHVRICAVYRLRRRRLRRSRAQRTATWSVKVYREQLAFTLLFYILYRLSLLDRNDIFCMLFTACLLSCAARVLPCAVAPPCGAWHLPSRAGRAQCIVCLKAVALLLHRWTWNMDSYGYDT